MTIDDVHRRFQFLVRKNQSAGISPREIDDCFNTGQRDEFDFLIGDIESFRYEKPVPRVGLGMNSNIARNLAPFKINSQTIAVASQIATYPAGFHTIAIMTDAATGKEIERMDDANLPARLNSLLDPISEANPGCYIEDVTGWKIYPSTITSVKVGYYKYPDNVLWNSVLDSRGRPVYISTGSVHPQWSDSLCDKIITRAVKIYAVSIQQPNLVQYGEQVIQTGA